MIDCRLIQKFIHHTTDQKKVGARTPSTTRLDDLRQFSEFLLSYTGGDDDGVTATAVGGPVETGLATQTETNLEQRLLKAGPHTVEAFLTYLHEHGCRESNTARKVATLRNFYRYLVTEGRIDCNPVTMIRPIFLKRFPQQFPREVMDSAKPSLTTGQVASICNVAARTASKWIDSGRLRGYRIPGSRDRRVPREELLRFMRAHGVPLDWFDGETIRVLLVEGNPSVGSIIKEELEKSSHYEVRTAECCFNAGVVAERFRPHVVLLDIMLDDIQIRRICRQIREDPQLQSAHVVALTPSLTAGEGQALLQRGFDAYLCRPFAIPQLVRCVEEVTSAVV